MAGKILCKQLNINIYQFVIIIPDGWKNLYVQINISLYLFVSINPVLDDNSFSDKFK